MTFSIKQMAQKARIASRQLAKLTSVKKNAVLHSIADNLESMTDSILAANKKDVEAGLSHKSAYQWRIFLGIDLFRSD